MSNQAIKDAISMLNKQEFTKQDIADHLETSVQAGFNRLIKKNYIIRKGETDMYRVATEKDYEVEDVEPLSLEDAIGVFKFPNKSKKNIKVEDALEKLRNTPRKTLEAELYSSNFKFNKKKVWNIIGFTGPARSGKDTAADCIIKVRTYVQKYSFAQPLKDMLSSLGLTQDELHGDLKEIPLTRLGLDKSPRQLMQTLGTEWGRNCVDKDLWLKLAKNKMGESRLVIPDVRFENEAAFVREHGILIHVDRPDNVMVNKHESENGISFEEGDMNLLNSGNLEQYKKNAQLLSNMLV
jgi:hypothetical protein